MGLGSVFRPSSESRSYGAGTWDAWAAGDVDFGGGGPSSFGSVEPMQLAAVRGCVRTLAGAMMGLPWRAFRSPVDGPQQVVASELLAKPTAMLPSAYKWASSWAALVYGNATHLVTAYDAAMYPKQLTLLDPGVLTHSVSDGRVTWRRGGEVLSPADVWNIPYQPAPGRLVGAPVLEKAGYAKLSAMAQKFGLDWFEGGAHPSGILMSDEELAPEQSSALKQKFLRSVRGREPLVMGSGLAFTPVQTPANESQFLETQRAAQVEICMVFGVQPEQIGISGGGSNVTYANRESRVQEFLTLGGLNPLVVTFQEAFSELLPDRQEMRIGTAALLRSDTKTRFDVYKIAKDVGILTDDEMRELEDRPPLPANSVEGED